MGYADGIGLHEVRMTPQLASGALATTYANGVPLSVATTIPVGQWTIRVGSSGGFRLTMPDVNFILKTDDNLLLMHTNMDAGHGGASGRFRRHQLTALTYAFFLKLV